MGNQGTPGMPGSQGLKGGQRETWVIQVYKENQEDQE
jgi:hypothetical protein